MDESVTPCRLCRHDNPPANRFCGMCGAPLARGGQLAPRRGERPAVAGRALPARLGPAGKALAVGMAALAAEAGLAWLRRRSERGARPSPPVVEGAEPSVAGYLVGRSLEEVYVLLQEGDFRSRIFAQRMRSFRATRPTDR